MAEDFLPVGIKAVVVGVDNFLADLRRMQAGVTKFGQTVKDVSADISGFGAATKTTSDQARLFAAEAGKMTQGARQVNSAVNALNKTISAFGARLGAANPKAATFTANVTRIGGEMDRTRGSVSQFFNSLATGTGQLLRGISVYQRTSQTVSDLKGKYDQAKAALDSLQQEEKENAQAVDRLDGEFKQAQQTLDQTVGDLKDVSAQLDSARAAQEKYAQSGEKLSSLQAILAARVTALANKKRELSLAAYEAQSRVDLLGQKFNQASALAGGLSAAVSNQRAGLAELAASLGRAQTALTLMNTGIAAATTAIKGFGVAIGAAVAGLSLIKGAIGGVIGVFSKMNGLFVSGVNKLKSFNAQLSNAATRAFRVGNSIRFLGTSLTFLITFPIVGFMKKLTDSAIEFEEAWAGVVRTVNDPSLGPAFTLIGEAETDITKLEEAGVNLRAAFRRLALEIPIPAAELARLGEIAGTLGIRGNKSIIAFVDTVARLGSATNVSAEEAAVGMGKLIGVAGGLSDAELAMTGLTEAEIESIGVSERFQKSVLSLGGVLTALGNETEAFESEILNFSRKIAGVGNVVGLTTAEILGFSSAFVRSGVDAARGGTAFQKVMTGIAKAVELGGEGLDIFAATAGTTVEEFVDLFRKDASEAIRYFVEGVGQSGTQAIAILEELGLADARVAASILSLAASGGNLTDSLRIVTEELDKQGKSLGELNALILESERRYSTTKSQLQLLKNQFSDLGITIGEFVLPAVVNLVKRLRAIIEGFSRLSPNVLRFILIMAGLVAIIGPVVTGIGLMLASLGFLFKTIFAAIGVVLSLASTLGLAVIPIFALIAAIGGLAIAFVAAFKKIDRFADETSETLVTKMFAFGRNIILAFAKGMAAAMIAVVRVLNEIGKVIAKWLAPGSPPKLLPDIDDWGTGAMQAYLDGWAAADFSVFNDIADKIESYLRSIADTAEQAGRVDLVKAIIGSRRVVAKATQEIRKLGKVTSGTMKDIERATAGAGSQFRRYIKAIVEVRVESEKLKRAQEALTAITKRYDKALEPIERRLKQISRRQQEISDRDRVIELEAILADPRAPEVVRELANLEIEQIGLEADTRGLEDARDAETAIVEAQIEAAEARLEAAEEELAAAEAMLDVTIKNNELLQEMKDAAEEVKKKLSEATIGAGDIAGFDPDALNLEELIPDDEGLFDDLFADLEVDSLADKISEGFEGLIADIKKEFEPLLGEGGLFDQLGTTWAPIFEKILDFIDRYLPKAEDLLGTIDDWSDKSQGFAEAIAGILDGVLTEFFGLLVDMGLIEPFGPLVKKAEETDGPLSTIGKTVKSISDFLSGVRDGFLDVVTAISEWGPVAYIIDVVQAAIAAISPAVEDIKNAWASFVEAVEPVIGRIIDIYQNSELLHGLLKFLGGTLRVVAAIIGGILLVVITSLAAGISGLIRGFTEAIEWIAPFVGGIIDGVSRLAAGFIQILDGIWGVVSGFVELIVGLFNWAFGGDNTGVLGALEKMKQGAENIWFGMVDALIGILQTIGGLIGGFFAFIIGLVKGWVEGVIDFFKNLFNELVGNSIVTDLVEKMKTLFQDALNFIIEAVVGFVTSVIEKIVEAKDGIITSIEEALDWLAGLPGKLLTAGKNAIQGFINGITSIDVGEKIREIGGNILGGIKGALGISSPSREFEDVGQESMEGWIKGVESKLGEIVKLYDAARKQVIEAVQQMQQIQEEVVGDSLSNVLENYDAFAEKLVNLVKTLYETKIDLTEVSLETILDFVVNWLEDIYEEGKEFGESWSIGSGSLWFKILDAVEKLWKEHNKQMAVLIKKILDLFVRLLDDLKAAFEAYRSSLRQTGMNLINSLISGLNARAGALIARARAIAEEVRNTINDAYQTGSPSKVFLEIGRNIIESWASGMQSREGMLVSTMSQLASSLASQQATGQPVLAQAAMRQAAPPVSPATVVNNEEIRVDLGGQTINNGMDSFQLQILIEQALRKVLK